MPLPGGRSANWSANMTSNSGNVKLPFLTTRCHYWGLDLPVDLPVDLSIWPLTVEMSYHHSWALDAHYLGVDLPIWALTVEMWNCHSWPLDRSATWSVNMTSNSRNVKLLFMTTRCYWGVGPASRSATWSANMTSNSRNVKLPFLTTRCHYWGVVDLPLDLQIWPLICQ